MPRRVILCEQTHCEQLYSCLCHCFIFAPFQSTVHSLQFTVRKTKAISISYWAEDWRLVTDDGALACLLGFIHLHRHLHKIHISFNHKSKKDMDKMLSLEFTYRSKTYYALIRTKLNEHRLAYYVTIMNGELERLLYGNHILVDENGMIRSEPDILDREIAELKQCITEALTQRLQLYGLVN